MRRYLPIFIVVLLTSGFWSLDGRAQGLPTYEDFRQIDRMRRMTGQLQTAELLRVTQIDHALIERVARQVTNDYQVSWGAAELMGDWPAKRTLFQAALISSQTNVEVALRYACAAAANHDSETALPLLHIVEKNDSANIVPWFVEMKVLSSQQKELTDVKAPPSWAIRYHDYAASAASARIHALEVGGYTPYAARRLGFMPDMPVLAMARDYAEKPVEKSTGSLLLAVAHAMEDRPLYLVTELVGESLERAVIGAGVKDQTSPEVSLRSVELDQRRDEIKALLTGVERNIVDIATESEMIQYFNDVLSLGEEAAMRRLAATVQGHPLP
jgi:hypothetical protein